MATVQDISLQALSLFLSPSHLLLEVFRQEKIGNKEETKRIGKNPF
jgi:hypothetical protein